MAKQIPDGYTRRGYIEAVPGLHGELRFSYRQAQNDETSEFYEAAAKMKARQADQHQAKFLKSKLASWDARWPSLSDTDYTSVLIAKPGVEAGAAAELTSANVLAMLRSVFQRVCGIVTGTQPTDIDPEWSMEETDEHGPTLDLEGEGKN